MFFTKRRSVSARRAQAQLMTWPEALRVARQMLQAGVLYFDHGNRENNRLVSQAVAELQRGQ